MTTVVILAAGFGSRLGRPTPKPLTLLANGRSIMGRQLDVVREVLGDDTHVIVIVGFKPDLVMEAFPECLYAYNEAYDRTNTSKSLLRGLRLAPPGGILWMNGDVVFESNLLKALVPRMADGQSFVCVAPGTVGDEEVSYTLDENGFIRELRKSLPDGLGEAIGINHVSAQDRDPLVRALADCRDSDYFERGMERATESGTKFLAAEIGAGSAIEVDFEEDLVRANSIILLGEDSF